MKKYLSVLKRNVTGAKSLFVFDSEMQEENSSRVFLFDTYLKSMQNFSKESISSFFIQLGGIKERNEAFSLYQSWKQNEGESYLKTRKENWKKTAIKRHKIFIQKLNKTYSGVKTSSNQKAHRTPHCYRCKENLDNWVNLECNECGWIICNLCGACGCGYRGRYHDYD